MKQSHHKIIFPLDVPSQEDAEKWIDRLSNHVGMFKVGLELFIQAGPAIIRSINQKGKARVFLDLKLHDIPETVRRAMRRVADLDVALATVHCGENQEMLRAAVRGADGKVGVLGVTVLTSVSAADIAMAGFRDDYAKDLSALVMKRASMAKDAGCAGVVCSGLEAARIKMAYGADFLAVTPGIRPLRRGEGDDQKRVVTPAKAIENGADYLVIGRPIRDADDPVAAAEAIASEIEAAMKKIEDQAV